MFFFFFPLCLLLLSNSNAFWITPSIWWNNFQREEGQLVIMRCLASSTRIVKIDRASPKWNTRTYSAPQFPWCIHSSRRPFIGVPSSPSPSSLWWRRSRGHGERECLLLAPHHCGAAFVIVWTVMPKHGPRMLSEISFKSRWMHKGGRDFISTFSVCCRRASCDCVSGMMRSSGMCRLLPCSWYGGFRVVGGNCTRRWISRVDC